MATRKTSRSRKPSGQQRTARAARPQSRSAAAKRRTGARSTVPSKALERAMAAVKRTGLTRRLPPPPLVDKLRTLMLDNAPEAVEVLEHDDATEYSAGGVFARIERSERAVLVKFLRGGELPTGKRLRGQGTERTVAVSRLDATKAQLLQKLVREAVALNLSGMVKL